MVKKGVNKMAKVDIISGFLGAGKTTLIKKLLNESLKDEKLVLIENEFGELELMVVLCVMQVLLSMN